jgi:hypothetical protein
MASDKQANMSMSIDETGSDWKHRYRFEVRRHQIDEQHARRLADELASERVEIEKAHERCRQISDGFQAADAKRCRARDALQEARKAILEQHAKDKPSHVRIQKVAKLIQTRPITASIVRCPTCALVTRLAETINHTAPAGFEDGSMSKFMA